MIQLIIAGAVALVLGLAGGTAFGVFRAPSPAHSAAKADSLATTAHPAHADSAHATAPPVAAAEIAHGDSHAPAVEAVAADPAATAKHAPAVNSVHDSASPPAAISREPHLEYGQVARILSSMSAQDAAKLIAYLDDSHVEGILAELGVRQAASLLTELPSERAARLSERLMRRPPGGKR